MSLKRESPVWLLAVIAIGVLIAAYAIARPNGFADLVTTREGSNSDRAVGQAPAIAQTQPSAKTVVPSPPAPVLDVEEDAETLDLPVDGVNDAQPSQAQVEDIPGRMTIDSGGAEVPAAAPALSDHSITSEDEVPGAN